MLKEIITKMDFHRFNQQENLYLTTEKIEGIIPKKDQAITLEPGCAFHYGINEYGIVSFGIWYDNADKRPGHGGFWSSRESIAGPLIKKDLVHIALNGWSASIVVEELKKILPAEYHIVPKSCGNETAFIIQKVVA